MLSAKTRRGVGGEAGLGGGDEGVERGVDDVAADQRVGLAAGRVEAAEAEDVAGVDAVGVADQAFDLGDGELGRAGLGRRPRRGATGGGDGAAGASRRAASAARRAPRALAAARASGLRGRGR